jgi:PHD/YefM family antitoxin component YafN of YafNO toxin-antitoxin module
MINLPVEEAKEKLAALVKQVVSKGETVIIQTADGLRAALVNLADLSSAELAEPALDLKREELALAKADTIREKILARRNGQPFTNSAQDLDALRELRLLELQGVY